MKPEAALARLLVSLFTESELRIHLTLEVESDGLEQILPGQPIAHRDLCAAAAAALKRLGLLDHAFFEGLATARPLRVTEIREVRRQCLAGGDLAPNALWVNGRFRLLQQIGKGNFAYVWKAIDTERDEHLVLKVLYEQHADDRTSRVRFFRGAAAVARLSHPSIVRPYRGIHGSDAHAMQEGTRYFFAMEYIAGIDLEQFVRQVSPSLQQIVDLILQIGDALEHIHERQLLHRDVKPANIIVSCVGSAHQAKLIDFDLVTGATFAGLMTTALGTFSYAPPEAFKPGIQATASYDVYGLAMTMLYTLRGMETDRGDVSAVISELPISEALRMLLNRALQTNPDMRTPTARRFCDELRLATNLPQISVVQPIVELDGMGWSEDELSTISRYSWAKRLAAGGGLAVGLVLVIFANGSGEDKLLKLDVPDTSASREPSEPDLERSPPSAPEVRPARKFEQVDDPLAGIDVYNAYGNAQGDPKIGILGVLAPADDAKYGATKPQSTPTVRQAEANVQGLMDKDIVRRIVRAHINEVRYCYNAVLARSRRAKGRVTVQFTIGSAGKVTSCALQQSTLNDNEGSTCIVDAVRRWTFPKPEGGGVVIVTYPFVLEPE